MDHGEENMVKKESIQKEIAFRAHEIIEENKGNIRMGELADSMGYSLKYLDRCFHNIYGTSMKNTAVTIRMRHAIRLLKMNLTDKIYEELGYYDQAYFIRQCKKYTGLTPTQLREADLDF